MQFKQLSYKSSIETKPVSVSVCKHVGAGSLLPLLDTRWTALFTQALELKLVFRRCLLQWTYKLYIKGGHGLSRLEASTLNLDTFMSSRGRLFCAGYFQFGYLASCQLKLTDTWMPPPPAGWTDHLWPMARLCSTGWKTCRGWGDIHSGESKKHAHLFCSVFL